MREVREMFLAATAIGGGLARVAAVWPAWMSSGVRTLSLFLWPFAGALSAISWSVERYWEDRERPEIESLGPYGEVSGRA